MSVYHNTRTTHAHAPGGHRHYHTLSTHAFRTETAARQTGEARMRCNVQPLCVCFVCTLNLVELCSAKYMYSLSLSTFYATTICTLYNGLHSAVYFTPTHGHHKNRASRMAVLVRSHNTIVYYCCNKQTQGQSCSRLHSSLFEPQRKK